MLFVILYLLITTLCFHFCQKIKKKSEIKYIILFLIKKNSFNLSHQSCYQIFLSNRKIYGTTPTVMSNFQGWVTGSSNINIVNLMELKYYVLHITQSFFFRSRTLNNINTHIVAIFVMLWKTVGKPLESCGKARRSLQFLSLRFSLSLRWAIQPITATHFWGKHFAWDRFNLYERIFISPLHIRDLSKGKADLPF